MGETIVKAEVHRLVIIDGEGKVCGVVSLSDILSFLVLRPSGEDKRTKSRPPSGPPHQSNSEKTTTIKEDATSDSHAFDEKKLCEEKPISVSGNADDDEPVNKNQ